MVKFIYSATWILQPKLSVMCASKHISNVIGFETHKRDLLDTRGFFYCLYVIMAMVMQMNYLFSGLIKCKTCGSNYRGKKDRTIKKYICSGYHNKSSDCTRFAIREEEIVEIIQRHLEINDRVVDRPLNEYVRSIVVDNEGKGFTIVYKSGKKSISSLTRLKY